MSFLWGAATAGHQVEGNNVNADIWLLEQVPQSTFREPSGDACDSLHRWPEDVALVAAMGLNCYRFSVEWSRIEPAKGRFSNAALDHYARIVDLCHAKGIAPVVTLSHFTAPIWFAAAGGWADPDAPVLFARFADRVARRMGDRVGHAITFNEPNLPLMGRWAETPVADPGRDGLDAMLRSAARAAGSGIFHVWVYGRGEHLENLLAGHRAARAAWKAAAPHTRIGLSIALPDAQPVGTDSGIAEYRRHAEDPFLDAARADDFIAIQTYGRLLIGKTAVVPPPAGAETNEGGEEVYPEALGNSIRHAHARTGKPVFVTENGIAAKDDAQRQRYLKAALAALAEARRDTPVIGYIHWSLLDNFEWRRGYAQHFGLVAVDRRSFRRSPKPSAALYAALVRSTISKAR